MAQTQTASVLGVAEMGDVVSFTDDDGHKRTYLVDDAFPNLDHNGNRNYMLIDCSTGRMRRSDLLAARWVFGS